MAKKEKTGTENLYEDALQSADVIYKLAETTAREGILEELGPNVKRFIAKKIKSESDSAEFDDTDDTDEIEEADEQMDDSDKELQLDDTVEGVETDITVDDTNDEFDINIDDISDEIDLDLSDILNGIDEEEPEEESVDESAQIDEELEEEELDIEALVKEIEASESDDDEDDEEIEITDESIQIDEETEDDDEELDLIVIDDDDSVNEEQEEDNFETDELVSENKKLKLALSVLKEKVDEFVLVNKKLKLISNTFALNNFSKKEKMKIIESFDRATTIAESVKVYNTIRKTVNKTKQRRISEGGASKVIGGTKPPKEKPPVILEHDNKTFKKWARLSGAKNGTFLDD